MKNSYYTLPLNFSALFPKEDLTQEVRHRQLMLNKTNRVNKSIDDFIELIITTHLGEYKNDLGFGFEIWELEFKNMQIEKFNTHNYPKQNLEKSLKVTIEKYEPRLKQVQVEIIFIYKKIFKGKNLKFYVDISVKGTIDNKNSDHYNRSFQFAMGPFFK
jgi:hypothetical protein